MASFRGSFFAELFPNTRIRPVFIDPFAEPCFFLELPRHKVERFFVPSFEFSFESLQLRSFPRCGSFCKQFKLIFAIRSLPYEFPEANP